MKFLISNDDGVQAPGLLALYGELSKIGEVIVIAPDSEQSGCASALHISQPLYTQTLQSGFIAVNGTPADCIYLGLHELYRNSHFDCVITGINSGANLGQDVLFSGTFGAALTAQLFGVPAIATSLVGASNDSNYQMAAEQIVKLITETAILETIKSLPYHVLNVNIPDVKCAADIKGRKITCLDHSTIAKPVHHIVDPRGRNAYWLSLRKEANPASKPLALQSAGSILKPTAIDLSTAENQRLNNQCLIDTVTDVQAIADGLISLSPVKLHHTPSSALDKLSALIL